jgi:hypothetical protein
LEETVRGRVLNGSGLPMVHCRHTHASAPGLAFVRYINTVSGMFCEIAIGAWRIARALRARLATSAPSSTAAISERNSS